MAVMTNPDAKVTVIFTVFIGIFTLVVADSRRAAPG
jgi:hypothetical protein